MSKMLNEYRRLDGEFHYPGGHDNSGLKANDEAAREAEIGSQRLKEALNKAIFKFGFKHSITTDEARHLLLNTGVRLPREPFLLSNAA